VNPQLSQEALAFGAVAGRAIEAAGGDRLLESAETDPHRRADLGDLLGGLGAWDLEPRRSADDLEAAATLCRSAGFWALPYPVAERLARAHDGTGDALVVVEAHRPLAAIEGVDLTFVASTIDGSRSWAHPLPGAGPRSSAFGCGLRLEALDGDGMPDLALGLTLTCWTLLGMLDRALDVTRRHVRDRDQFGQPLAQFQGVQFQLTDAEVERSGVEELAKYTLWSTACRPDDALADALALRLAAIEAAETVFRVAHQLHGAIGFCDESIVSWLSRHSQPLRRLPFGPSATMHHLTAHIGGRGLSGLFDTPDGLFDVLPAREVGARPTGGSQ
jgi:hypothetical protein